jgi:phosphoserine aminotransferase
LVLNDEFLIVDYTSQSAGITPSVDSSKLIQLGNWQLNAGNDGTFVISISNVTVPQLQLTSAGKLTTASWLLLQGSPFEINSLILPATVG